MDPPMSDSYPKSSTVPRRRITSVHSAHQRHQPGGYGGGGMGSSHLFDDTSADQHGPMPGPGQQYAGVDFLQAPVTNMAFQYGTNMASQGKEYVEKNLDRFVSVSKLKYYFAVDTGYVVKKLGLLLFPFTHKNWAVQYNKSEPVAPRYEINAPDLYIPVMAFVTYVLVAGLVLGTQNRFTPEQLGITASSALIWLVVEIMAILFSMYVCNVQAEVKTLDLLAFCGYKYFGMILSSLAGLLFNSTGYYTVFIYMSITDAFFLIRTLRLIIMPETESDSIARTSKRRIYLLLFIAALQPFFMYFLTNHLRPSTTTVES
uniref:Protein YIF1 n=1 Tax=Actinia tenebrosa TaxID=6105 RepID=A0A6P8J2F9_ACTTE